MILEELKKKALSLDIEFEDTVTEEDLTKMIDLAEEARKDDLGEDTDFFKNEAKKAFNARDKEKKEKRRALEEIAKLKKQLDDSPTNDELSNLKTQVDELGSFRAQILKEKEDEDLKNKTEFERAEYNFNKKLEELNTSITSEKSKFEELLTVKDNQLSTKESEIKELRVNKLQNRIHSEASKNNAYSSDQIVDLLTNKFSWNDESQDYEFIERNEKGRIVSDLSIEEKVKNYLTDEGNKNLIRADVSKGVGDHKVQDDDMKQKAKSKSNDERVATMSDDEKELLEHEADFAGLTVGDYLDVKAMKDEALDKVANADAK